LATYLTNLGWDDATAYYLDLCFLKPPDVAALLGHTDQTDPRNSSVYAAVTEPYLLCPSKSPLQKAQYADLRIYLPNDVLVKVDRMSMQHSLEVRSPLLDHRITEFAFRIPTASKLPRLDPKHLLRELGRRRLPTENLDLPKRGFTAPVGSWFRGFLGDRFRDEALGSNSRLSGLVDLDRARLWLEEHQQGRADRSYALWALWSLEMWARSQR
jgi:asparagine synthase (glutamine-hydrolysing)